MSYSALDIAKWFLAYNNMRVLECGTEYISNLKLQKLLYYAFGTYYAVTGEPLFTESILAWKHGPVVKKVYDAYKCNKSDGIKEFNKGDLKAISQDVQDILIGVYERFGQYSAWKLRNMTHMEKPWLDTPQKSVIPKESIKKYFEENYIDMDRLSYFEAVDNGTDEVETFDNVNDFLRALNA